jgi:PAS domain S-box-containing protein
MGERSSICALRKSGEEFPADATISKIAHGDDFALTVVLRDTTERVRAEERRRRDAEKLRQALAAGRLGAFEHDPKARRIKYFGHAPVILGIQATELAFDEAIAMIDPDDRELVLSGLSSVDMEAQSEVEYRIRRPDGSIAWIRTVSSLLVDSRAERMIIGTIQDVTAWKAVERELEQRVSERTRELQLEIQRREEVQASLVHAQKMEAFGQLTGGIAHDFNNLLTVIGGNLELIEGRVADERASRQLRRAIDAVGMGARLTERLLTFARRRKLAPETLRVNELVVDIVDLVRRTLGDNIEVTSKLAEDLDAARADPSELENAILNLALNARDAMPHGGKLVIETANTQIDQPIRTGRQPEPLTPGAYVRISVSDNGMGMPRDVAERAFEPFFTTKETGKGTGLGLSTVYGFARQSDGGVTLYSEPGAGTTVNLYLPRSADHRAAPDGATPEAVAPAGLRVLVVEDDEGVSEVAVQRLERLGMICRACGTAVAAIAELETGAGADLVLSDVMMPGGMSGYDLAAWMKLNRPDTALILTTGFAAEIARRDGHGENEPIMLRKPYTLAELAAATRQALGRLPAS